MVADGEHRVTDLEGSLFPHSSIGSGWPTSTFKRARSSIAAAAISLADTRRRC